MFDPREHATKPGRMMSKPNHEVTSGSNAPTGEAASLGADERTQEGEL